MQTLTIEQAFALAAVLNSATKNTPDKSTMVKGDGRIVIVRSRDAGVLYGNYQGHEGSNVYLTNAVQMWKWKAANGGTLVDCASFGVENAGCKFSNSSADITVFNACALIDCTDKGAASLKSVGCSKWA